MLRGSTVSFGCIAFAVGIVLFRIKYEVVDLENRHIQILKSIHSTKESIHLLNAEWAHLTDPARIQRLSAKYLDHTQALPEAKLSAAKINEHKIAENKALSINHTQKKNIQKPVHKKNIKKAASLDDLLSGDQSSSLMKEGG